MPKPKKIYFSTTEIVPFANVSSFASFSTVVPAMLQELGHDIRTIIPKYGFISCLLYTSPSPRDVEESRMPSSA